MCVHAVFSASPLERFDHCVVRRPASSTEVQQHAVGVDPQVHRGAHHLGPVVAGDPLGETPLKPQALKGGRDILVAQAVAGVNRQAFTGEEVDAGQGAVVTPLGN
jgi:hypothetical protein